MHAGLLKRRRIATALETKHSAIRKLVPCPVYPLALRVAVPRCLALPASLKLLPVGRHNEAILASMMHVRRLDPNSTGRDGWHGRAGFAVEEDYFNSASGLVNMAGIDARQFAVEVGCFQAAQADQVVPEHHQAGRCRRCCLGSSSSAMAFIYASTIGGGESGHIERVEDHTPS